MILDEALLKSFLVPITSPEQMRDWVYNYLDIDIPLTFVDPDSNSSPVLAMYEAYNAYNKDTCLEIPGFIWLASRDSGKTLCGSILNVLLMIHFKAQIAHLSAIKSQSERCLQYCHFVVRKLKPYIEHYGRKIVTESKTKIKILNEDESESYIDVIVATLAGGNSLHTPVVSYDELDTLSPQGIIGYKEAKLIPTRFKNKGPLVIKFSTRKFAFGIFEQEIQRISETGEKLMRWNIIDSTEHCPELRHRPDEPKVTRYIRKKELPLSNISPEDYMGLMDEKQQKYSSIECYAGCANCSLLPVCFGKLADRPKTDVGGLFKPVEYTVNQFKKNSPDMAEAQLLCWKPSTRGLVYPKFDRAEGENTYTVEQAWTVFTGEDKPNVSFVELVNYIRYKGIPIYGHVDWGYTHNFSIVVSTVIPNGEWWILHTVVVPGLELDEMVKIALELKQIYGIKRWHPDNAQPSFIKTFNSKGLTCIPFKKDVDAGIEAVRTQVIDASGCRRLKIIKTPDNEFLMQAFEMHHFKLDAGGLPTKEPDDKEYADPMDCTRYGAQNLFKPGNKIKFLPGQQNPYQNTPVKTGPYNDWMSQKISQLTGGLSGRSADGSVYFDFSNPDDIIITDD